LTQPHSFAMEFGIITIVHAVLALLLIIELGLTGHAVDRTSGNGWFGWSSPSSFAFMLFCSIWSILVLLYLALTPRFLARIYNSMVALGLLVLTALFWFAGSIAMAVKVSGCGGTGFCATLKAAVAFGFFIWAAFTGLAVMEGLAFMRGRGHGATADVRAKPGAYPGA